MRSPLLKLALLGLLAPLAACGSDANTVADLTDTGSEDTSRPDTEPDVEDAGIDTTDAVEEDATPDTIVPDLGPDTQEDTGPEPARCGNGVRENGEVCDGDELLPGVSCQTQGFAGGDISCNATCSFDVSDCYEALCGDGIISGDETCDGDSLGDRTCESEGFAPGGEGTIACGDDCQVDTSACELTICGNENIEGDYEACDGTLFGDDSCRARGFFGGELVCDADCANVDDTGCVTNICGNNTVEGPETCDGSLAAVTCRDLVNEAAEGSGGEPVNFVGGTIACTGDCLTLDTSGCVGTVDELGLDTDGDGIADDIDNCVEIANPRQLDFDADTIGNVCDAPVEFATLVGDAADNLLLTNAGVDLGGLGGGGLGLPIELQVEGALFEVAFDDEGVATTIGFSLNFGESTTEIDLSGILGGGGLPIPLPLPTSIPITVLGGAIDLDDVATPDGFTTLGDFADYIGGLIDGDNDAFGILFSIDVDAADAGASSVFENAADISSSSSAISLWDRSYAITFADSGVALGTLELELSLGGGLPIPFGFPISVNLTGLEGTVAASIE